MLSVNVRELRTGLTIKNLILHLHILTYLSYVRLPWPQTANLGKP
jgi:hypothetical protein